MPAEGDLLVYYNPPEHPIGYSVEVPDMETAKIILSEFISLTVIERGARHYGYAFDAAGIMRYSAETGTWEDIDGTDTLLTFPRSSFAVHYSTPLSQAAIVIPVPSLATAQAVFNAILGYLAFERDYLTDVTQSVVIYRNGYPVTDKEIA